MSDEHRDIKTGDIVRLKSGGPKMTVDAIIPRTPIGSLTTCKWFDGNGNACSSEFALVALVRAD